MLVVVCAAVYESVLLTDCYVLPWCLVPLGAVCVNRVFSNTLSGENDSVNECFHDLCASYGSRCFFQIILETNVRFKFLLIIMWLCRYPTTGMER